MSEFSWAIKNWVACWDDSPKTLLSKLEQLNLKDKQIDGLWTLWDGEEWFNDAPVVLVVEGHQIELCVNQIGLFSLTTDSIDLESGVAWCAEKDEQENLVWRKNAHSESSLFIGKRIKNLGVLEYCLDKNTQEIFGTNWVLTGVFFEFDNAFFEVFNALDCNGLSYEKSVGKEFRYHSADV